MNSSSLVKDYAEELRRLLALVPDETAGARAARIITEFDGAAPGPNTLLFHLCALVETRPEQEMYRTTNCATTMRWIYKALGCPHPWCAMPDEKIRKLDGAGPVSWILKIARDMGALITVEKGVDIRTIVGPGWGIRYWSGGNNDHMEWCADENPLAPGDELHCGGGRAGNKMTCSLGDIRYSLGRPAQHLIDPEKMGIETARSMTPFEKELVAGVVAGEGILPVEEVVRRLRTKEGAAGAGEALALADAEGASKVQERGE